MVVRKCKVLVVRRNLTNASTGAREASLTLSLSAVRAPGYAGR
jgi:hypothetical protein